MGREHTGEDHLLGPTKCKGMEKEVGIKYVGGRAAVSQALVSCSQ